MVMCNDSNKMFDAFNSDNDSDEKKTPQEKRKKSDTKSESDTKPVLKRTRIEEDRKNKKMKKEPTLTEMKKKLFMKVCAGTDPEFKTNMKNKNSEYIESLSNEIDAYIDSLVQTNYKEKGTDYKEKGTDLLEFSMSEIERDIMCTETMNNQCNLEKNINMINDKACVRLPGYYDKSKQFIPQLYHILQDYGFFYHYLKFPMMDEKLSNNQILARWSLKLGEILGSKSLIGKQKLITVMLLRLRRVQFMRSLDIKCCLKYAAGNISDHVDFDVVLETVYDALLSRRSEIIKNNPHLKL